MTTADNGGLRYSEGKPRYDLLPPEFMQALAVHYQQGARKYPARNWERGMNWGECFRALMSHAWKWAGGERFDSDPATPGYEAPHLIALAWNAIALYVYETRQIGVDDIHRIVPACPPVAAQPQSGAKIGVAWGWALGEKSQPIPDEAWGMADLWYVATPYTRYRGGIGHAHHDACRHTAALIRSGIPVYSPIAHTHAIATIGGLDPVDHALWVRVDAPLVNACSGLIVVKMDGWDTSCGITHEVEAFKAAGKPIILWDPNTQRLPPPR